MRSIFGSLNLADAVALSVGALLLLKKIVDMKQFHRLRVIVLTALLSCLVIYLFLAYAFPLATAIDSCCTDETDAFRQTEM